MIKPSSLRISFETSLIMFTMATFGISMYYMFKPQTIIALLYISMLTIPIGILMGVILSTNIRIKILRRMTRKNFGFVKFVYGNLSIKTIIANLDNDIIKFADGVYNVEKGKIKRQLAEDYSDKSVSHPFKEIETVTRFEDGIPTTYFNIDDAIPLDFKEIPKQDSDKYRIPAQISATLNKEIAVEKAKALKQTQKRLNLFLVLLLGGILIIGYLQWKTMEALNQIGTPKIDPSQLDSITSGISDLSSKLTTLTNQINELPSRIVKEAT